MRRPAWKRTSRWRRRSRALAVPFLLFGRFAKLRWIDSKPFRYDELDGTEVVVLVLTLAGYRFYQLFRLNYELKALLVLGEQNTVPCRFHVRRTSYHPGAPIVVRKAA